ncbi:MAG: hypothetical protein LAO05_03160 [Acidobacteriia bacterium]|nr:hypothetical protein [Terriglobia bacterium]
MIEPVPAARRVRPAQAVLALFFANLLLRGDGHFPFSKGVNPALFDTVVLVQTAVLLACSAFLIARILGWAGEVDEAAAGDRWLLGGALASVALVVLLHALSARRFAEFGYVGRPALLGALAITAAVALAALWRSSRAAAVLAAAFVLKVYPLLCFPIRSARSDMLPILQEAGRALLSGENIYRAYLLDNGIWTPMVRFPGLVMAYAPATLLDVDPRLVTLVAEALFFLVVWRRFRTNPLLPSGLILLALSPYWHFRHELYEAPFWVALTALLLVLERRSPPAEVAALALVVCMHQWGVLFLAFVALFLARSRSRAYALALAGVALGVGTLVVVVASQGDVGAFWQQTMTSYAGTLASWARHGLFPDTSLYLTPWIAALGGATAVKLGSLVGVAVVLGWAWRRLQRLRELVAFLAAALLAVLLTNTVAWTYQYLLVGALLWLGLMLRAEQPAEPAEPWTPEVVRTLSGK